MYICLPSLYIYTYIPTLIHTHTYTQRSTKSGNFIFNVNARVDMVSVKKLFDYEMFLPISTIIHFRTLSTMIASVEMFNGKRLQARQANKGNGNVQPYERIGMTWADIVLIHSELTEVRRVEGEGISWVYMAYIVYNVSLRYALLVYAPYG